MSDDNGLYYMRARYYSPELLRFINADPEKGTIADGATLNAYAYANGNPISYVDPFGASAELSQAGHTTLDTAGFWPGAGIYFDATNAVWYAAEGDWANFGWSAIAAVPIGGDLFQAGRLGIKYLSDVGAINRLIEKAKSAGKQLTKGAGNAGLIDSVKSGKTPVIGKMKDLETIGTKEIRVADYLPNKGDPKLNWQQNSSVLRQVMNEGKPIRDASPFSGKIKNDFLGMERNLLQNHGWTYNNGFWLPPK